MSIQESTGAICLDPQLALAFNNRGDAYKDLGRYQKAIQDYNEAIRLDPYLVLAYSNRGAAYQDWAQHENYFSAAHDIDSLTVRVQPPLPFASSLQ